jgi:carbamoyl-phosphate synthase large subunit
VIISLNDVELPVLANHRGRFEALGTKLLVSSPEVIDNCFDKLKTAEFLNRHGFLCPETFVELPAAEEAVQQGRVEFPLFVKPRWGSASLQIFRVETLEELKLAFLLAQTQLQKTILKVDEHLIAESILIQEGVRGIECGIDILNDLNGDVQSVYAKRKLGMRAGETDKSDVFLDGEQATILELNPRFGGGYPFSHMFGANYPQAIVDWCQGKDHETNGWSRRTGVVVSKCDSLVVMPT